MLQVQKHGSAEFFNREVRLRQLIWFSLPLLTKTKQSLIFLTDARGQMLVSIETKGINIPVTPLHRQANNCNSTVWAKILVIGMGNKASKTETLDLCQLPRPLFEIHKMINLPASVKIFKNELKNWETDKSYFYFPHQAKRNKKLMKFLLSCLKAFYSLLLETDLNILQIWTTDFHIFQYKFNQIWKKL